MLLAVLPGITILSQVMADDAPPAFDGYLRYSGTASVRHSSEFLYGEQHVLHYHAGQLLERVVLYTCRDGSAFARKTVSYVDRLAPDFLLEDSGNGLQEGIRSDSGTRIVFFRAHASEPERHGPLPHVDGIVADAGFDNFVRSNWQSLMSNAVLPMPFLVPSHLDDFSFQVRHLRSETLTGIPIEVFRLRPSGLWSWLPIGIDVYYTRSEHLLVRYEGLSDLRDHADDPFKTEITFPPDARRVGREEDLLTAREAALHPCP